MVGGRLAPVPVPGSRTAPTRVPDEMGRVDRAVDLGVRRLRGSAPILHVPIVHGTDPAGVQHPGGSCPNRDPSGPAGWWQGGVVRALTYAAFGATPAVCHRPRPDPAAGRRRGAGAVQRPVPQRLARLDGPRRRHHGVPARARPRAGRGRRGGRRRRGCRVAGSRGHGALRHGVRGLPGVPGRGRPGLPEPAAARVHRPGLVRRARRRARRRDQPRGPAPRPRRRGGGRARAAAWRRPTARWSRGPPCARATRCSSSAAAGSGSRPSPSPAAAGRSSAPSTSSAASLDRALFHGADEVVDASIGVDKVLAAVGRWSGGGVLGEHRRPRVAGGVPHRHPRARPPRAARAGGAAAPGRRPGRRADGAGHRLGARRARQPRDGGRRLRPAARRRGQRAPRPRRPARPGEPLGLAAAGEALVAMGSAPSTGIVLVDPAAEGAGTRARAMGRWSSRPCAAPGQTTRPDAGEPARHLRRYTRWGIRAEL